MRIDLLRKMQSFWQVRLVGLYEERLVFESLPRILKIRKRKIAVLKKKVPHKIFLWCWKSARNYYSTYWVYAHKDDLSSQTSSFFGSPFNAGGIHTLSRHLNLGIAMRIDLLRKMQSFWQVRLVGLYEERLVFESLPRILTIRKRKIAVLKKKVPHKIFLWCRKSARNYYTGCIRAKRPILLANCGVVIHSIKLFYTSNWPIWYGKLIYYAGNSKYLLLDMIFW